MNSKKQVNRGVDVPQPQSKVIDGGEKIISGTGDFKSFSYFENGDVQYSNYSILETLPVLKSGCYDIYPDHNDNIRIKCKKVRVVVDMFEFENKNIIQQTFLKFFDCHVRRKIQSLNHLHKLGVLLYGREGCGKSTVVNYLINLAVSEHNAIVFFHPSFAHSKVIDTISSIRTVQDNPVLIIFEELDAIISSNIDAS